MGCKSVEQRSVFSYACGETFQGRMPQRSKRVGDGICYLVFVVCEEVAEQEMRIMKFWAVFQWDSILSAHLLPALGCTKFC